LLIAMGTLAKRLGQLAARSIESESSNIIKNISANKSGLSRMLDQTLRTSHDMKVFGLGTAASMANRERYTRFTNSMLAVYTVMEHSFDTCDSPAVSLVWGRWGDGLRRKEALASDLAEVCSQAPPLSPETRAYCAAIEQAAAADTGDNGARLLGHLYCRYFADLFGGQALGGPYRWALNLSAHSPRHYDFGELGERRRQSIEGIYVALNKAGEMHLDDEAREVVVREARIAFAHNVSVYKEEGRLLADGTLGLVRMVGGFARSRVGLTLRQ